ncbi:hypothetical protein HZB03_02825 [Candidatus Woesearchaeota archaeon]|nr:hypothetical protein [Candidatus Woesearchaeota archaeon]
MPALMWVDKGSIPLCVVSGAVSIRAKQIRRNEKWWRAMEGRTKKVSVLVFLFGIFVLLGVIIGGWLYSMYTTNVGFTNKATATALRCGDYSFAVESIAFDPSEKVVSFTITNLFGDRFDSIVVESGQTEHQINLTGLVQGGSETVSIPLELGPEVLIYPQGCRENNAKRFSIR